MDVQKGFTLIELIIFIIVMAIIALGILASFSVSLRYAPDIEYASRATELAQQRMDLILGQRYIQGFSTYTDPCVASPSLPICAAPSGYTVASSIVNNWGGDTNYNVITVTVSGLGSSTLTGMVANY